MDGVEATARYSRRQFMDYAALIAGTSSGAAPDGRTDERGRDLDEQLTWAEWYAEHDVPAGRHS